ncbi:MAG: hypothetical protein ACK43K_08400, partial [Chitinophagales bacterium]
MIDFKRKSWVSGADSSEFPIQNLPFGIYNTASKSKRVGVAIGSQILDLAALVKVGVLNIPMNVLENSSLNDFIALGKSVTNKVRLDLADLLDVNNKEFA